MKQRWRCRCPVCDRKFRKKVIVVGCTPLGSDATHRLYLLCDVCILLGSVTPKLIFDRELATGVSDN
jgi:hypothetical protein